MNQRPYSRIPLFAAAILMAVSLGCGGGDDAPDASIPVETLEPEPTGAPVDTVLTVGTDLDCLGEPLEPATGSAVELTGYVRTLADPTAEVAPPAAQVEVFTAAGDLVGSGFADSSKQGRIAVSVSFQGDGFNGYAVASETGYLDYRFQSSRIVARAEANAYAWLIDDDDVAAWESALGITNDTAKGILIGSVHDCEVFAMENVVIQVDGATDGVHYPDGPTPTQCPTGSSCPRPFAAAAGNTFTNETGRFLLPNVAPGPVTVKAFGRLTAGGPLTLLGQIQTAVSAGAVTAVSIQPRTGVE